MSCKLNIIRDSVGNIIIQMSGNLEYKSSGFLKESIEDVYYSYPEVDIKIDMSGVEFVGSSGICHFVDTLKAIHLHQKQPLILSNPHIDFRKVFMLYNLTNDVVTINNFSLSYEEDQSVSTRTTR